eukprot:Gb_31147 [translate_table: standard]
MASDRWHRPPQAAQCPSRRHPSIQHRGYVQPFQQGYVQQFQPDYVEQYRPFQPGYTQPFQPECAQQSQPFQPDFVHSFQPGYNQKFEHFQPGYGHSLQTGQDAAPSCGNEGKHFCSPTMHRGRISALVVKEGYGFLAPLGIKDQVKGIYFRFGHNSKTETGLLDLQLGDVLEFILNSNSEKQWATFARLLQCSQRTPEVLASYMDKLLLENPGKVLREVTKTPAGFLLVLNARKPSFDLVSSVLKLSNFLSMHNESSFYKARLKQFYKIFSATVFIRAPGGLQDYIQELCSSTDKEKNEGMLLKKFLLQLTDYCKHLVSDILSVLRVIVQSSKEEDAPSVCQFILQVFSAHVGGAVDYSQDLQWKKLPLHPIDTEMNDGAHEVNESRTTSFPTLLPRVVQKGSYGSTEAYLDTYFQLLKEDCFANLKKGISAFKANKLDPRDMRVWIRGSILGVHFGTGYSGLSIAIKAEKLGRKFQGRTEFPMNGGLLCISDDGGNFDSPIWAIVTQCEEENKTPVIFTEILDGEEDVGPKSFSRLLGASNIVLAESPSYYKAYQPVLKSLQQMDLEKLPFKSELVDVKWPGKPPDYLTSSTTLDWSCLFNDVNLRSNSYGMDLLDSIPNWNTSKLANLLYSEDRRTLGGKTSELDAKLDFGCKTTLRSNISELDNLLTSGYQTTLDESQLKAVKLALNNRLVLIQGPPGTGKTYIGVKILQLLLTADTLPSGPIIVITYKNHSLDQFLVSCLKFCKGKLVRVGGRSTEPVLEKYNLNLNLNEVNIFSSDLTDNRLKLKAARWKMEKSLEELKESNVLSLKAMLHHIPDKQLKKLLSNIYYNTPLLKLVPVDVSLVDFIENGIAASKQVLPMIYQALSQSIIQWMPSKETFELVKECLSMEKLPRTLEITCDKNSDDNDIAESSRDFEEENEERNELRTCMAESIGPKKEWLKEDLFRFREDENSNPFGGIRRLNHVDLKEYGWVLNENPWHLKASHRAIMVHLIMQINHEEVSIRFADAKREYDEIIEDMKEITKRRQLEALKNTTIVGMTTTGAAMHQDILKMLAPSIIMVEEAAEVLEPQLLAAIRPSTQHLILIGDHYQLPPPVESYKLKIRHGLGVSMFERLVEHNIMPFQALCVQSRMHEEFLPMILPIYPNVRSNTKLVTGKRNKAPTCMMRRMHFWSHSYKENLQRSFANEGEAKMVIALAKWLTAEGQNPEDITILAAYNGQVSLLREKMAAIPSIQTIQVQTIDRFQGSENQIIIVSLVRSNKEGNIGHLGERNRLCVSVSRARSGIYLCGNDMTLATSQDWRTLMNYFKEQECMGNFIYLCCPRHPHSPPLVIDCNDVDLFNPLLCKKPCNTTLQCRHNCHSTCHFGEHPRCSEKVQFLFRSCGHEVTKKCSEDEETLKCHQEISVPFDDCGHIKLCKCWERSEGVKCEQLCGRLRQCGHTCTLKCFEKCERHECDACLEIKKVQAEMEKEQAILEIKMKLKELQEEIKRLKMQKGPRLLIKDLSEEGDTAAEYLQVLDRTEKFIQPGHGVLPIVTKIEKVSNVDMQIKFLEAQRDLISPNESTQLLFHGTDDNAIQSIIKKGFKLPAKNKKNMFGQGCYFATDSTKSAQQMYTKGSNKLLLCEVHLGHTWTVQEPYPDMDLEKIRKRGYDSIFSKRKGKNTGGTLYDEFVIYDTKQAIVRYIVHYKRMGLDMEALNPQRTQLQQQNLIRIPYEMSASFSGDSPSEYHFRLAESQFFRMSSRSDFKVGKVELILNMELQKRYETSKQKFTEEKKKVEEMLVFHGTDKNAIEKIIEEGFKIGGDGIPVRNGRAFGSGVYTALDPSISIDYTRGGSMVLLSLALVGQEGSDYNKGGNDGVFVLHKSDYLLPKYIVHFQKK